MKKLFIKLFGLVLFVVLSYGIFLLVFVKPGKVDRFYPKVSSPKVDGLILGSSRGFFGLNPDEVFKDILPKEKTINFAFTLSTSPYGSVYVDAVKRKINRANSNGLFILETSPLAISVIDTTIKEPEQFRENELLLAHLGELSRHPNVEYIFNVLEKPLYEVILQAVFNSSRKNTPAVQLNGWMKAPEIKNKEKLQKAILRKEKEYRGVFSRYQFSETRLNELKNMISFLSKHGEVVLVRLPTSVNIREMEENYMPTFDIKMKELAEYNNAEYLNYNKEKDFQTIDANHLNSDSANKISKKINQAILSKRSNAK